MKYLFSVLALCALTAVGFSAKANYNTDAKSGTITCRPGSVQDSGFKVTINASRTLISFISAFDPGHPEEYKVVNRDSDGDTYVSYGSQGNGIVLSFDDRGDSVYFGASRETTPVRCR